MCVMHLAKHIVLCTEIKQMYLHTWQRILFLPSYCCCEIQSINDCWWKRETLAPDLHKSDLISIVILA